jgi:hypothetical protein
MLKLGNVITNISLLGLKLWVFCWREMLKSLQPGRFARTASDGVFFGKLLYDG